jgi:hypothetical protein
MLATILRGEPPLRDVLEDPVVHAVMRRDGVTRELLEAVIEQARCRLAGRGQAAGGRAVSCAA